MKTIKRLFFACLIGTLFTCCSTARITPSISNDDLVKIMLDSSVYVYYHKWEMPKVAQRVFETIYKENSKLADNGEFFNRFDLHTVYVPSRRLILGGNGNLSKMGYIVFEAGGTTDKPTCIFFSSPNGKSFAQIQMIFFKENVRDIVAMRAAVRDKKYEILKTM